MKPIYRAVMTLAAVVTATGAGGGQAGAPSAGGSPPRHAEERLEVPPPPFSDGIFPCSNCHAGRKPDKTRRVLQEMHTDIVLKPDDQIRRVVLCSGKVYYDLYEEREKRGLNDVYLLRVEQLYPFPAKALITELSRFQKADIVWCQEEPKNMGAWSFIDPYLEWVLGHIEAKHQRVQYAGRPASASPATGLMSKHLAQLQAFLDDALGA